MTDIRRTILAAGLAALCAQARAEPPAATRPGVFTKIKLGYETTRIVEPLRPDGTVDYLAAINQAHSRGVTPENNAAVKLLEAFEPAEFLPDSTRDATLKILGVKPLPAGEYFVSVGSSPQAEESYDAALKGPWQAEERPELARWLKRNEAPLSGIIEGSGRPRYYRPLLTAKPDGVMIDVPLPSLSYYRPAAKALIIRANLAAGEGRIEDAWADILAAHRLGVLLGKDSALMGRLVGMAIVALANDATGELAASGRLSAEQARRILEDLSNLGPTPSLAGTVDVSDRYCILDIIVCLGKGKMTPGLSEIIAPFKGRKASVTGKLADTILAAGVDWNDVLRRANYLYDTLAKAMRLETISQRKAAYKRIDIGLENLHLETQRPPIGPAASEPARKGPGVNAKTRWIGSLILSISTFSPGRAQMHADRVATQRELAVLSVALAAYEKENGRYPATLDALAPGYLETVTRDFFSGGGNFIYKPAEAGYLLYSVGENERDDGGLSERSKGGDDIVVKAGQK